MKIATLPAGLAFRILGAFGFGFFLSMFTRASANMLKLPIQHDLGLSEAGLGFALGTSFFIAFGLAQLPIGVLLDRYDPRRVNAVMLLVAATGTVIFAFAHSGAQLAVGRVLMGMGFGACMMAALKTYFLWFPGPTLPTVNGIQFAVGFVGAISATKPTEWALRVTDWRGINLALAALAVVAAAVLVTVAPKHVAPHSGETLRDQIRGIGKVYGDGYFWRTTPLAFISIGISQGLGTMYVVSWLRSVGGMSEHAAANVIAISASVSIVNYLLVGKVMEWLGRRGVGVMTVPWTGISISMTALLMLTLQLPFAGAAVWIAWQLSIGWASLTVAVLARNYPPHMAGRVYTGFNQMSFLFTAFIQWMVGWLLDLYPRTAAGAAPEGYRLAFAAVLGIQVLGALWTVAAHVLRIGRRSMLERETHV
ncbi:MAG: MFS transporter [Alphaproteobacteria bacterium]|nr:MFS transporter [Alphaproteobacteria bacterium]